jgi:RNA polymerase sigma-70 factor (ECF subfamily)
VPVLAEALTIQFAKDQRQQHRPQSTMPKKTVQNRLVYDHELILRMQRGDHWVFHLLIRRFCKRVFAIAFGISFDVAESQRIAKEVFLAVDQTIGGIKSDTPVAAWLQQLTVARCLTWQRRWARRFNWWGNSKARPKSAPASSGPTRQWIQAALRRLPNRSRAFFVLNVLEGLNENEIADITGSGKQKVRHHLDHAYGMLSAMFHPFAQMDARSDAPSCQFSGKKIYRYRTGGLSGPDKAQFESHLEACPACRNQLKCLSSIAGGLRDLVNISMGRVDFTALEKTVLYHARDQRLASRSLARFSGLLRYAIVIAVIAVLLALLVS